MMAAASGREAWPWCDLGAVRKFQPGWLQAASVRGLADQGCRIVRLESPCGTPLGGL